ncbi:hypothetical protein BJ508DRAFT_363847 [Ascobolus immersus RN42]|uniref:Uncharacterized protein n=1 Tax=Ascobolus immersus RN42 TaxID=1160509 RepID=A0A3N4HXQ2_ASCIM|nr:hypothetical protein BJ508DRAFT_363847 [Ascobolus immersus RN42]
MGIFEKAAQRVGLSNRARVQTQDHSHYAVPPAPPPTTFYPGSSYGQNAWTSQVPGNQNAPTWGPGQHNVAPAAPAPANDNYLYSQQYQASQQHSAGYPAHQVQTAPQHYVPHSTPFSPTQGAAHMQQGPAAGYNTFSSQAPAPSQQTLPLSPPPSGYDQPPTSSFHPGYHQQTPAPPPYQSVNHAPGYQSYSVQGSTLPVTQQQAHYGYSQNSITSPQLQPYQQSAATNAPSWPPASGFQAGQSIPTAPVGQIGPNYSSPPPHPYANQQPPQQTNSYQPPYTNGQHPNYNPGPSVPLPKELSADWGQLGAMITEADREFLRKYDVMLIIDDHFVPEEENDNGMSSGTASQYFNEPGHTSSTSTIYHRPISVRRNQTREVVATILNFCFHKAVRVPQVEVCFRKSDSELFGEDKKKVYKYDNLPVHPSQEVLTALGQCKYGNTDTPAVGVAQLLATELRDYMQEVKGGNDRRRLLILVVTDGLDPTFLRALKDTFDPVDEDVANMLSDYHNIHKARRVAVQFIQTGNNAKVKSALALYDGKDIKEKKPPTGQNCEFVAMSDGSRRNTSGIHRVGQCIPQNSSAQKQTKKVDFVDTRLYEKLCKFAEDNRGSSRHLVYAPTDFPDDSGPYVRALNPEAVGFVMLGAIQDYHDGKGKDQTSA